MTTGLGRGANVNELIEVGDYVIHAPLNAWTDGDIHLVVKAHPSIPRGLLQQGRALGAGPFTHQRTFRAGAWGDWATTGQAS
jgi:hypothetical protein